MNQYHQNSRGGRRPQNGHSPQRSTLGIRIVFPNGEGNIDADLFDATASKVAKCVADCKPGVNKSTQLRRFYDELVMWEEKARQNPKKFEQHLPFIRMLKAKAAYAEGRKLVDGAFVDLLDQTVDSIKTVEDLRIAKLFFEAFMGFYKLKKGD